MTTTPVFKSNKTQAIRLPKAVSLPNSVTRVTITVKGKSRIITPVGHSWDDWFDSLEPDNDLLIERDQPAIQERDQFSA